MWPAIERARRASASRLAAKEVSDMSLTQWTSEGKPEITDGSGAQQESETLQDAQTDVVACLERLEAALSGLETYIEMDAKPRADETFHSVFDSYIRLESMGISDNKDGHKHSEDRQQRQKGKYVSSEAMNGAHAVKNKHIGAVNTDKAGRFNSNSRDSSRRTQHSYEQSESSVHRDEKSRIGSSKNTNQTSAKDHNLSHANVCHPDVSKKLEGLSSRIRELVIAEEQQGKG